MALAIYMRGDKKSWKKKKWDWLIINQKTFLFESDSRENKVLSVYMLFKTLLFSSINISYIFLRHSNPLWKTKRFLNESLRGQRDYCIYIYMILMQIFW